MPPDRDDPVRLRELAREQSLTELEQASIVATLDNLRTFPWVRERIAANQLQLVGAFFGVATGILEVYEPQRGSFAPIAVEASAG